MTDYGLLRAQLAGLLEDEPDATANLANAAALLKAELPELNWVGFYLTGASRHDASTLELILGPFQGLPACIRLPYGKGVCGTSWQRNASVLVPDVHAFAGHIACDSASESELVVPLRTAAGEVFGVLDLDSPRKGRFTDADREGLEAFCQVLERALRP